ncbi:hypothetical protein Tco_1539279 [Tanacetum coccineum]
MVEDGKLKIDSMMVMILVSVRCRLKTLYNRRSFKSLWQKPNLQRTDIGAEGTTEGRKDKEVNQAARDSDDALVCCVENTVEDRIMDSGVSFHATYCKEELERFKLRSGKVRLADDKTLDIAGVRDVVLKTFFGTSWTLKDVRWFGEAQESFLHNVSEDKETTETAAGVTVEASKMLWADSVSTAYLIYRILYVPIGLRIPEEEWRGKDTSLTHLKVFGCDSFVKVKDVSGEENMKGFEDSRRSNEEDSEDRASSKGGGFETLQVRRSNTESKALNKAINEEMVSLKKNQTCSLVRLPAGKKASQRLLMFKVKEEQNSNKSWAKLVRILISEGSLSLLKIFGMKSLAAMFTREKGYSQFNDVSSGCLVTKDS